MTFNKKILNLFLQAFLKLKSYILINRLLKVLPLFYLSYIILNMYRVLVYGYLFLKKLNKNTFSYMYILKTYENNYKNK